MKSENSEVRRRTKASGGATVISDFSLPTSHFTLPRLRFPEFQGASAWNEKPMGDLYSFLRNNTLSRDSLNYEAGSVKNIHYGDIHTKFPALFEIARECVPYINSDEGLSDLASDDYCVEGDMVFADASEDTADVGKSMEIVRLDGERLLSGQHTILARRKDDALIVGFGGHLFRSALIRSRIEREAQGTKVYQISSSRLGGIDIPYPDNKGEQQKIAECLTSLDEVIAAQGRKVEALKAHKRGLMQQLFPREGETRPRLRFPEFRNAPVWHVKLAGKLFENRKKDGEDGLPIYSVTVNEGMIPRASFDRDFYDIEDPSGNKKACKGDIAYNMMRMWQGAQGVAVEDCMVSPAYVVLAPLGGTCSAFFAYLFKLQQSLELLAAHSRGLTKDRLRLYFDDFARMPLCVPEHEEQQRIADCLTSLDTRIRAEADKLVTLKTHKQGLMQQLFPAPEGG